MIPVIHRAFITVEILSHSNRSDSLLNTRRNLDYQTLRKIGVITDRVKAHSEKDSQKVLEMQKKIESMPDERDVFRWKDNEAVQERLRALAIVRAGRIRCRLPIDGLTDAEFYA